MTSKRKVNPHTFFDVKCFHGITDVAATGKAPTAALVAADIGEDEAGVAAWIEKHGGNANEKGSILVAGKEPGTVYVRRFALMSHDNRMWATSLCSQSLIEAEEKAWVAART